MHRNDPRFDLANKIVVPDHQHPVRPAVGFQYDLLPAVEVVADGAGVLDPVDGDGSRLPAYLRT